MSKIPCTCCPSIAPKFALPDGDDMIALCAACLVIWLRDYPEDAARLEPLRPARPVLTLVP